MEKAGQRPAFFVNTRWRWIEKILYLPSLFRKAMANHKSALKRVRQTETRNERNRYQHKTTRNAVRTLRSLKDKKEAEKLLPEVSSMLDKLAKRNIIHKNKAANLKSSLKLQVNGLK